MNAIGFAASLARNRICSASNCLYFLISFPQKLPEISFPLMMQIDCFRFFLKNRRQAIPVLYLVHLYSTHLYSTHPEFSGIFRNFPENRLFHVKQSYFQKSGNYCRCWQLVDNMTYGQLRTVSGSLLWVPAGFRQQAGGGWRRIHQDTLRTIFSECLHGFLLRIG